jgi:predicted nuclease of predicted toxin-antitoxin system
MLLKNYHFITDENIPPKVVAYVRSIGINVLDIVEQGLASTSDAEIIQLAVDTNRIILTQDSDFGTFFFKEGFRPTGIVYIRPGHVKSADLIKIIDSLLGVELEVKIPFIIVAELVADKVKIRLREI